MTNPTHLRFSVRDSAEMAAARRQELNIPGHVAANLGHSAVEIAREGGYRLTDGREISIAQAMKDALSRRVSIPTDQALPSQKQIRGSEFEIEVCNETTLGAARRWVGEGLRPLALNFANGVQPGGGFLSGALAQEEAICRSSGLYLTLEHDPMYYAHRQRPEPDSTDWAILSFDVPIFRSDIGELLEAPWALSFLTCAAPYAPAIGQPRSGDLLQKRIIRVLEIASAYGFRDLILGAWGCGAFGNDPHRTASDFRDALLGRFFGDFDRVKFAICDWSPERRFIGPFREVFVSAKADFPKSPLDLQAQSY
jgi:uncharacterized protein (TIGR02452 family)